MTKCKRTLVLATCDEPSCSCVRTAPDEETEPYGYHIKVCEHREWGGTGEYEVFACELDHVELAIKSVLSIATAQ